MNRAFPMVPLARVIRHRKEFIRIDDAETYKRCRVQLRAQGIVLRDIVSGSEIKTKKQQVCRAGELLVAEIDAKVGGFGIVPDDLDGAIVSSHYFLFQIDNAVLNRRFLDFFIRTPTFRDQVSAQGSTNYAAIRPNDVLGYEISLPPLEEQRCIVARIEGLVAKIDEASRLRRVAVEEAKAFASSLHLHMAGERFLRLDAFLMLEEIREDVRPGQEYPQVGVKGFGKGLFEKGSVNGGQTTYKAFNRLYYGAVVLSQVKGWEGALAVCCSDLSGRYVSPEYRTFRCVSDLAKPEYLAVIFATPWFWTQLKNMTRGVGARRERIRPEQFLRIEIPMPTAEQQAWAMPVLASLSDLGTLQAETAAELDAMLPSILDMAFKGEL